jgi:hypothetical protein
MPEKQRRCQHDPIRLYDEPHKRDLAGWLFYSDKGRWVICSKCRETGYWGGHGFKRRIRWGYGWDMEKSAAEWNAWVAERAALPECTDPTKDTKTDDNPECK